jgi:hypothetical protein
MLFDDTREVQSMADVVERNYTIYVAKGMEMHFGDWHLNETVQIEHSKVNEYLRRLNEPDYNGTLMVTSDFMRSKSVEQIKFRMLEQKIMTGYCALAFPRNHFLFSIFNEKIGQMISSGIMQKIIADNENQRKPKIEPGYRVVAMHHIYCLIFTSAFMGFCFQLFLNCFCILWNRFMIERIHKPKNLATFKFSN